MRSRRSGFLLMTAVVVLASGCSVPHRDVLLFGTDTSLGVNVGADPAAAQVTNVSIGYKRREAVYMPLVVNGTDSKFTNDGKNMKYAGRAEGEPAGEGGKDTYSVFASFGGSARAATAQGGAQVAQFFATGIAAQRLAKSDRVTELVSTSAPQATEEAAAAAAARPLTVSMDTLPPAAKASVVGLMQQQLSNATMVSSFITGTNGSIDTTKRDCLLGKVSLTGPQQTALTNAATPADFNAQLSSNLFFDVTPDLAAALPSCQTPAAGGTP